MSSSAPNSAPLLCVPAALLTGALAATTLCAQPPSNPLRLAPIVTPAQAGRPTPADPRTRPRADHQFATVASTWTEPSSTDQQGAPRSVVPPAFGQPETLPPDPAAYGLPPGDHTFDSYIANPWSQELVHRWFVEPWFSHSDPNDPHRHVRLGQPLIGTSWRNRPLFVGAFYGGILADDLIDDRVDQSDTWFLGLRAGADFDHYWGVEFRYAFAPPELTNDAGQALGNGHSRDYFADVELVHYPWGDSRWRPYLLAGIGFQTFRFYDDQNKRYSESLVSIPIGSGLKYFWGPWCTLRFDFVDNIALGNDHLDAMHNISFMAGAEYRFGGSRQSYYPWHNNMTYW